MTSERFLWQTRPLARKENIVIGECYRFTALTDRLIRMEYAENGVFEDRASQHVFYRDFDHVAFSVTREDDVLTLRTDSLRLTYRENEPFSSDSLRVQLLIEPASMWCFGEDFEDLGGTVRTLDGVDGEIPLERGVCSRNGFSVLDDSESMLLGSDGWVEVRRQGTKDVYFFGYGFDYLSAVKDFMRLTGEPPLLPSYALGNWWSRYHRYTQQEYIDLMERFKSEHIPFSVGVIDMDWHITDIPKDHQLPDDEYYGGGWTGYTWNEELFPDYKVFLRYLKDNHLRSALNLHPHAGVRSYESMYEPMAKAMGIDPKSRERVKFDILSKQYMANYFDVIHHPYEEDGVDFWWMDWQQGTDYHWIHEPNRDGKLADEREVLDPLWMLNHLHILDIARDGKRPMFFSRYSGPGSQRYPVGFSGDTFMSWASLRFQPYFTATASNIGYCWWSHDIGGHMFGYRDDELTVRWMQLGVLSPINRLHSTSNHFQRKEPWCYTPAVRPIMKEWLQLRHALFPYLYTMNYRTHTELLPLVQPMYYTHPKHSGAYEVKNQYRFGSELIVSAITDPCSEVTHLGKATAWLPKGDWFDAFNGMHYASARGRKVELHRDLAHYPVLAKAGAIVPMARFDDNRLVNAEELDILVFPGAGNTFTLYEDGGDGQDYRDGAFTQTAMTLSWGKTPVFTVAPAKGDVSLIPKTRRFHIKLRGFHKTVSLSVQVDGKAYDTDPVYDPDTNTITVSVTAAVSEEVRLIISGDTLVHDNADAVDRCVEMLQLSATQVLTKCHLYDVLHDSNLSVHAKLNQAAALGYGQDAIHDAMREWLTLTEDEFLGNQTI